MNNQPDSTFGQEWEEYNAKCLSTDDPELLETQIPKPRDLEHPENLVVGRDIPAYWF